MNVPVKSDLQVAAEYMTDVIGLMETLRTVADQVHGVIGAPALMAKLEAMNAQGQKVAATINELANEAKLKAEIEATVCGEGEREYQVLLTLDTTAARFVRVFANSPAQAGERAQDVAVEEQGAHFAMNEGNHVRHDDVSVTAVLDKDGNELDDAEMPENAEQAPGN